ncbi:MAG: hypothetical protein CL947_04690 [Epsilonproteobacteria bacterium]|nr:hypothetical protein [Campylobacterota bacterium]|tara:strand:+ start:895 stop:1254 length:360 start_codon:yes stop_codon:yes gene_type:complete
MKKIIVTLSIMLICVQSVQSESIIKQKPKKDGVQKVSSTKLKEQLAAEFEDLLHVSTHSIKHLSELVDDIVVHVKQLAGQQEGILASADKKTLQQYQEKVAQLKGLLQTLDNTCRLADI